MQDLIILQTIIISYGHRIVFFSFFFNNAMCKSTGLLVNQHDAHNVELKSSNGENCSKQCNFGVTISYQIVSQNQTH